MVLVAQRSQPGRLTVGSLSADHWSVWFSAGDDSGAAL